MQLESCEATFPTLLRMRARSESAQLDWHIVHRALQGNLRTGSDLPILLCSLGERGCVLYRLSELPKFAFPLPKVHVCLN